MTHNERSMQERAERRQEVRSAYEMGAKVADIAKAQSMSLRDVYAILKAQEAIMRHKPVTESMNRIIELRNLGWSVRKIADETGHHRYTVAKLLYRDMVDASS